MLCLTRPRICTCTHTYYPYRLTVLYILSSVKCIISIGGGFRNRNSDRDSPSSLEEGKVRPEAVM